MALAGSRWLVMKNSVQSLTRETRRRRRRVGSGRKSEGKGRGEMRGRWEMSEEGSGEEDKGGCVEVEERKVMNREAMKMGGGWKAELQTDRQAGQGIKPRAVQGGQAEDQSCLPSLPGSPPRR